MITKVFAIYDTKSKSYAQPFYMLELGAAIRAFADLANDKQSSINKHPSDYVLFQLGDYDDRKGIFTNVDHPQNLGLGSDYVERPPLVASALEKIASNSPSNSASNGKIQTPEVLI